MCNMSTWRFIQSHAMCCLFSDALTSTGNVTYILSVARKKKKGFWDDTKGSSGLCDKPPTWKHIHLTSFNSHIIRRDHFHLHVVSTSAGGLLSRDKFLWRDKQCSATSPLVQRSQPGTFPFSLADLLPSTFVTLQSWRLVLRRDLRSQFP